MAALSGASSNLISELFTNISAILVIYWEKFNCNKRYIQLSLLVSLLEVFLKT